MDTAKVEEVVGDFVTLKRRGVNMIGLCPFHGEKTPSFTVSPAKGIYKCFGCGKAGNSTKFIMEHEGLSFPEALKWIARKYGIKVEETEVTEEDLRERQLLDSLYLINDYAREFFQKQLFETEMGKSVGLAYFKRRGFREETIRKFGLGFSPRPGDVFTAQAVSVGYNIELLRQLGLTSKYDKDFFRNRVMFTIQNVTGKNVAFAGRILENNPKAPKYVNSPETPVYVKNKVLYGLNFAKVAIRKADECLLVEGYTDVISLHQAGVENVVASSGTSLTTGQIRLVKRYSQNMKILYDGDAAGVKAALRGLDMVLAEDMNVRVVLLPEGEDPDSFVQSSGTAKFKQYLDDESKDFIHFKSDLLLQEAGDDPVARTEVVGSIVTSIAKIPDPVKRQLYVKSLATKFGIDERTLLAQINRTVRRELKRIREDKARDQRQAERRAARGDDNAPFPGSPPPEAADPDDAPIIGAPRTDEVPLARATGDEFQEKDIARLLIKGGHLIYDTEDNSTVADYLLAELQVLMSTFDHPLYSKVVQEANRLFEKHRQLLPKYFVDHADEAIRTLALQFIDEEDEYSPGWAEKGIYLNTQSAPEENFPNDSKSAINRFALRKVERQLIANTEKLRQLQAQQASVKQINRQMKVHLKLTALKTALAKKTNTVILR